ncbi:hypothetical protein HWV62_3010 [Athelia sp. TMB]|nr:hypothetical protein HWV62_3010 [Athelia sp. TMB]
MSEDTESLIAKYDGMGYKDVSWRNRPEARKIFMTGMERRVGDSSCWTIHLSELNDHNRDSFTPTSPPILQNLLFDNTWKLVGAGSFMQMKFCVVSLSIFRYSYTVFNDTEALVMREFYDGQWPLEKSAKRAKVCHQTWWDGKVQEIKEGKAQHVDYEASTEDDSDLNVVHMEDRNPAMFHGMTKRQILLFPPDRTMTYIQY